jgi:hypothetical protein
VDRRALKGFFCLPTFRVPENRLQSASNLALSFALPRTPLQRSVLFTSVPCEEPLSLARAGPQDEPMLSRLLASRLMASVTGAASPLTSATSGRNRPPAHGATLAAATMRGQGEMRQVTPAIATA